MAVTIHVEESHRVNLTYDEALVEEIAAPLHRSGERRAQRGSHSDPYAAAAHLARFAGRLGRWQDVLIHTRGLGLGA
jgi:hypothetical protein